jgi:SNF2 family DNA or RNA helicase
MDQITEALAPGQIARVRQRTYLVEEIVKSRRAADSTLVRLSCVDDDNQGQPLEVLWEKELDPQVLTGEAWEAVASKGFDESRVFAAYLNTLKWNCVTSTDPKLFQSPFRAGIRLDAYQLEPLRKALLLPRVNLFIADDVGLGKTIEAGLIARELLLRKKVKEIFVSCPPSMLLQWKEELEARFGLTFEILDKEYMKRVRRERGFSVNPWGTHTRVLVSHRLLRDETYVGPLRDHLGTFRAGSLFILDEAHHAAPSSGAKYAIDSQITRAMRDLAPRFEHRLFLSATPHNGHSNSFSALLEILDPQRFCRGVPVTTKHLDEVIVRRLKEDIRELEGGFPKRNVVQITIDGLPTDAPELRLSRLLDEYRQTREERLKHETKRKQASSGLLITGLQQRLLSSIEAFARTLKVHRKTVKRQWEKYKPESQASGNSTDDSLAGASGLYSLDLLAGPVDSDNDRATLEEEQLQAEEDAQFEAASAATMGPIEDLSAKELFAREQELLDEMTEIAEQSRGKSDARTEKLIEWIRDRMCPDLGKAGAKWNDTRVLIFTEYDDTKRYLVGRLEAAMAGSDRAERRIQIFHGPTPPPKREEIKQAFNTDPRKHPLRILIATDAAREGLNLQAYCHNLFHFDVPWNPSRMEQRNGRVDRKLQPEPEVFCHYFVYKQRPEDRILQVLVRKTETIKEELGSLSQVIDAKLAKSLSQGIRHKAIDSLENELEATHIEDSHRAAIEDELESTRLRQHALREQIDRLRTLLENSRKSIGLSDTHFRAAISSSLQLMGVQYQPEAPASEPREYQPEAQASEPLSGTDHDQQASESALNHSLACASGLYLPAGVKAYRFPAIDERSGADPTWAETMDTLRVPRKRDQKLWDWRREAPIRQVVFEDPGIVGDDVVHLHLEQRVVKRLLGRFTAQGFVHHDLSRACFAQATDSIPRVVLLGRLCLYGIGAARLHEELIPVTARWAAPDIRKGPLSPYAKDAEAKTMALLEDSLLKAKGIKLTPEVIEQLQQAAAGDIHQLLPHLETRGEEYAADAEKKLAARGAAEAKAMREILETQRKHISTTVKRISKLDPRQKRLDFGDIEDELLQLDANKRYWAKRLEELREELKTEPARIEDLYTIKARRVEPVGLVYLWPVTG